MHFLSRGFASLHPALLSQAPPEQKECHFVPEVKAILRVGINFGWKSHYSGLIDLTKGGPNAGNACIGSILHPADRGRCGNPRRSDVDATFFFCVFSKFV